MTNKISKLKKRIVFETLEESIPTLERVLNGEESLVSTVIKVCNEEITEKMVVFVKEYVKDFNASRAATQAGYSPHRVNIVGTRLLSKASIGKMIELEKNKFIKKNDIEHARIAKEFKSIAFYDPRSVMKWNDGYLSVKSSEDLTDEEAAAIKEVYTDKDGNVRFKFHDKTKALESLAKYFNMIGPDVNINVGDTFAIQVNITEDMKYKEAAEVFLSTAVRRVVDG